MAVVERLGALMWSPVMLMLFVGTGLYFSVRLKFLPIRKLFLGIRTAFTHSSGKGEIPAFFALMTSLGATIGSGNIVGVATAYAFGGPGAIFWMWICALAGISTGYAEGIIAIKFRVCIKNGQLRGGAMYALENGLKRKALGRFLAIAYCVFTVAAALCSGSMVQANAVSESVTSTFNLNPAITAIAVTAVSFAVIFGGLKSVSSVSARLVPFMGLFYIIGGVIVIILNISRLGAAISLIIKRAFCSQAAVGGAAGASVMLAMRYGAARGVFSNETGTGSASIASSAAITDFPVRQGLIQMTTPFFDTLLVCTITALAIACTDSWQSGGFGAGITIAAFESGLPGTGKYIVSIGLILFAFTSILGWSFYGERALEYLAGSNRFTFLYRIIYCIFVFAGALAPLKLAWGLADIAILLMALPNLFCLLSLRHIVIRESQLFWSRQGARKRYFTQTKKPTPF